MTEPDNKYELARATTLENIGKSTSERINSTLPGSIRSKPDVYGLDIAATALPSDLEAAGDMFARTIVLNHYSTGVNRFSVGDIINHLAMTTQEDVKQVVEDLELTRKTGLSQRAFYTFAKTASRVRFAHRHANLAWNHFSLVASFKGVNMKKDPIGHVKFEDARMQLLDMVSTNPEAYSLDWIREQMKKLQNAGQVKVNTIIPKKDLFEYASKLLCIQAQLGPADLAKMGKTTGDVTNAIEELQNELINREIIDPTQLVWPHLSGSLGGGIENAETVDEEEDDDEG